MSEEAEISFALRFLSLLNASKTSTVFSPASILNSLATLFVGSAEETAQQIQEVIGKNKNTAEIIKYYSEFVKSFKTTELHENLIVTRSRRKVLDTFKESEVNISMVNRLFAFNVKDFRASYGDLIKEAFDGGIQNVDIKNQEVSIKIINKFVEEATKGVIKRIIESEDIKEETSIVMINAIYFEGNWEEEFELLENEKFYSKPPRKINMLEKCVINEDWNFRSGDSWKALGIPYKGRKAWLFIVLPNERGGLPSLLKKLNYELFKEITIREKADKLFVTIPKVDIELNIDLKEKLPELGIIDVFSQSQSNLSKMMKHPNFIAKAQHKAVIKIDEKGTVAAAATANIPVARSIYSGPIPFTADHPFLYFISTVDNSETFSFKNLLFVGTFC